MEEIKPVEQLSKKENWELKHQAKEIAKKLAIKKQRLKRAVKWISGIVLVILLIGGLIWYFVTRPPTPKGEIISRNGIHWHSELIIYIKDEQQKIPKDIGIIGTIHKPVHTHDTDGIMHLEFGGLVRKTDITLGQFFKNWNKDIRSLGANMKMTVNGKENTEYENYIMQDKDKIELRYE